MNTLNNYVREYLDYCECRKHLDKKTIKAYNIDLKQYLDFSSNFPEAISKNTVDLYITELHKQYQPKTIRRKIASLKAFFHYMEYKELLSENPFLKLDLRFREPNFCQKQFLFIPFKRSFRRYIMKKSRLSLNISKSVASGILPLLNYYLPQACAYLNYALSNLQILICKATIF